MKLTEIKEILGGDVSTKNSKMPGTSFGLSTDYCNVGYKLRSIPGSVCESCYAARLEAFRPSVKKGWTNRAKRALLATDSKQGMERWVTAMQERLTKLAPTHHRWHDSGDLLNIRHLRMINRIALNMPDIKFWLPTKEKAIVNRFIKNFGEFAPNLTVRLSAPMVDQRIDHPAIPTSMVTTGTPGDTWVCPARHQGNACNDCRACWDRDVDCVAYPKH
jgi:hypothetical protein